MRERTHTNVTSFFSFFFRNIISFLRLRQVPERPPKLSPLTLAEMNNLNLKQSPIAYPKIEEFTTDHDYEALSPSYNLNKPTRPAPRPPATKSPIPVSHGSPLPSVPGPTSPVIPSRKKGPAPLPRNTIYKTLDGYNGMEGVPFVLNPKLRGLPSDAWVSFLCSVLLDLYWKD